MTPATLLVLAALTPASPSPAPLALEPGLLAQAPPPAAAAPQTPAAPAQPQPPPGPAPETWVSRPIVELSALDKVSAHAIPLVGRVGQDLHFGSLTVVARACMVRPPDAAPDAAAFLDITDSRPGTPPFHAWMLLSEPSASIYEHPVYDIRLTGCRAG